MTDEHDSAIRGSNQAFPHYPRREENTGHGHVYPRPDGQRTRCGGPGRCPACTADGLEAATAWTAAALDASAAVEEVRAATQMLAAMGVALLTQRDSATRAYGMAIAERESGLRGTQGLFQQAPSTF